MINCCLSLTYLHCFGKTVCNATTGARSDSVSMNIASSFAIILVRKENCRTACYGLGGQRMVSAKIALELQKKQVIRFNCKSFASFQLTS